MKLFSFPTLLKFGRLIISPLVLPLLLAYLLPQNIFFINGLLALLFVLLSLTEFFDAFLARQFNIVTRLGKQLDPIADRFLTYCTFVALVVANKIFFYWVILFFARDFFVMGLRAIAREKNFEIPVSFWERMKRFGLMAYLAFVILNPYQSQSFTQGWNLIEFALLCVALLFALLSAKNYFDAFKKQYGPVDSLFGEDKKVEPVQHDWFNKQNPDQ